MQAPENSAQNGRDNTISSEALETLKVENQQLRELVVSLSATLLGRLAIEMPPSPATAAGSFFVAEQNATRDIQVRSTVKIEGVGAVVEQVNPIVIKTEIPWKRELSPGFLQITRPPTPIYSANLSLLTPRELSVYTMITDGSSSKETARFLKISPRTVDVHRASILQKLGAKNTVDLCRFVPSK